MTASVCLLQVPHWNYKIAVLSFPAPCKAHARARVPLSPAATAVVRPPRRPRFGLAAGVGPQTPLLVRLLRLRRLPTGLRLLPLPLPRISADVAVVVLRIPPSALMIGRRPPIAMVGVTRIKRARNGVEMRAATWEPSSVQTEQATTLSIFKKVNVLLRAIFFIISEQRFPRQSR